MRREKRHGVTAKLHLSLRPWSRASARLELDEQISPVTCVTKPWHRDPDQARDGGLVNTMRAGVCLETRFTIFISEPRYIKNNRNLNHGKPES